MGKKLSVIIPIFNEGEKLIKCVDSIEENSDIEIIIVDDASTDSATRNIIIEIAKNRSNISYFFKPYNGRQGSALNVGLKSATGEYITFVDADDYCHEGRFTMMMKHAKFEKKEVIFSELVYVRGDGNHVFVNTEGCVDNNLSVKSFKKQIIYNGMSLRRIIYSRDLIFDEGIFFPENIYFEDNYWGPIVFSKIENFTFVQGVPYYYVYNPTSTTSSFNRQKLIDRCKSCELLISYVNENDLKEYEEVIVARALKLYYPLTVNLISKNKSQFNEQDLARIRTFIVENAHGYLKNSYIIDELTNNDFWHKNEKEFTDLLAFFEIRIENKGSNFSDTKLKYHR